MGEGVGIISDMQDEKVFLNLRLPRQKLPENYERKRGGDGRMKREEAPTQLVYLPGGESRVHSRRGNHFHHITSQNLFELALPFATGPGMWQVLLSSARS